MFLFLHYSRMDRHYTVPIKWTCQPSLLVLSETLLEIKNYEYGRPETSDKSNPALLQVFSRRKLGQLKQKL